MDPKDTRLSITAIRDFVLERTRLSKNQADRILRALREEGRLPKRGEDVMTYWRAAGLWLTLSIAPKPSEAAELMDKIAALEHPNEDIKIGFQQCLSDLLAELAADNIYFLDFAFENQPTFTLHRDAEVGHFYPGDLGGVQYSKPRKTAKYVIPRQLELVGLLNWNIYDFVWMIKTGRTERDDVAQAQWRVEFFHKIRDLKDSARQREAVIIHQKYGLGDCARPSWASEEAPE